MFTVNLGALSTILQEEILHMGTPDMPSLRTLTGPSWLAELPETDGLRPAEGPTALMNSPCESLRLQ